MLSESRRRLLLRGSHLLLCSQRNGFEDDHSVASGRVSSCVCDGGGGAWLLEVSAERVRHFAVCGFVRAPESAMRAEAPAPPGWI